MMIKEKKRRRRKKKRRREEEKKKERNLNNLKYGFVIFLKNDPYIV